jgi:hypothetical protein
VERPNIRVREPSIASLPDGIGDALDARADCLLTPCAPCSRYFGGGITTDNILPARASATCPAGGT